MLQYNIAGGHKSLCRGHSRGGMEAASRGSQERITTGKIYNWSRAITTTNTLTLCVHTAVRYYRGTTQRTQDPHKNGSARMPGNMLAHAGGLTRV